METALTRIARISSNFLVAARENSHQPEKLGRGGIIWSNSWIGAPSIAWPERCKTWDWIGHDSGCSAGLWMRVEGRMEAKFGSIERHIKKWTLIDLFDMGLVFCAYRGGKTRWCLPPETGRHGSQFPACLRPSRLGKKAVTCPRISKFARRAPGVRPSPAAGTCGRSGRVACRRRLESVAFFKISKVGLTPTDSYFGPPSLHFGATTGETVSNFES